VKLTRISVLIWLAAMVIRLVIVFAFGRYELFRPEPVRIAISLANSGAFADPYAIPTGFTAHAAPLYPAMLAPIYYFFGDTRAADFARIILSVAAASASYALLPGVAQALGMGAAAGILAGAAGALLPAHFWPESMGEFETAWVPVFLEISVILFAKIGQSPPLSVVSALCAGAWCGLGILLSPSVVPVLIGWGALAVSRFRSNRKWYLAAVLATFVTIAPWLARNYLRLGDFVFIRDNLGLELFVSNNDHALAEIERNDVTPFYRSQHPFDSSEKARELRGQGEAAFERERTHRAMEWIRANPLRFAALTGARFRNFWFQELLRPLPRFLLWTLNAVAVAGALLLFVRNRWAFLVLGSLILTYPLIYYLIQNGMRYEHGVYWVTLLLASEVGVQLIHLLHPSGAVKR